MVIAAHVAQLLVVGVDVPADGFLGGEIEGTAGHRAGHGGGDAVGSHGGVAAGGEPEAVVHGVAAAVEVEVAVVGQVAVGGLIGGRLIVQGEALLGEGVCDLGRQAAGEAALPVKGGVSKGDGALAGLPGLEALLVKTGGAAVELLGTLVGRQGNDAPVDHAAGPGDAVGVPANDRAQISAVVLIAADAVVAQHHVHMLPVSVRDLQQPQRGPVCQHFRLQMAAAQGILIHSPSVLRRPEGLFHNCHKSFPPFPRAPGGGSSISSILFFPGKNKGVGEVFL